MSVEIKFQAKGVEYVALVSPEDEERVRAVRWRNWAGYAHNPVAGLMHQVIMGDRPADVPEDYVIDHRDRVKLNNTRENLRWVPQTFNLWNHERARTHTYRGVSFYKGKWRVYLAGISYGTYDTERAAGRAYAKACVLLYGDLAAESDILVGEGPGKFSAEEMEEIKKEIANGDIPQRRIKKSPLPKGISLTPGGRYKAEFRGKEICRFDTLLETQQFRDKYVQEVEDKKWADHLAKEITRDAEGHAVISLGGKYGTGKVTKVPEKLWHNLTYNKSYRCDEHGYARYSQGLLHALIWGIIHPGYVPKKGWSIDHINPRAKLDNREENLRLASDSGQASNKQKREGSSSDHVGIHYVASKNAWRGTFRYQGKNVTVQAKTESRALEMYIARKKGLGLVT